MELASGNIGWFECCNCYLQKVNVAVSDQLNNGGGVGVMNSD